MLQRLVLSSLDDPPTLEETYKNVKQLQAGEAPVPDGIPPKLFKEGGEVIAVAGKLTELMQEFWDKGLVPQEFTDANIIHLLYKNEDDRTSCDNHRRISLLSIPGKILAGIILNCITHHLLDDVVSESQCAFRRNRGTIDTIFAVRQINETCREQNQNLCILFVYLTKAFDRVGREGLWAILLKLGCPLRVLNIIRSFHDRRMTCIVENGFVPTHSQTSIASRRAVHWLQRFLCSLPCCFMHSPPQILASPSATDVMADSLELRRLKARTKVLEALARDFLFAEDCSLAALNEPNLQELASCLSTAANAIGLTISLS